MNKKEEKLQEFLSYEGICCYDCIYYNENAKISSTKLDVCIHEYNKQNTLNSPEFFRPKDSSFMCERFREIEEK